MREVRTKLRGREFTISALIFLNCNIFFVGVFEERE